MNNRDKFWLEDPKILIRSDRLVEFSPTFDMTTVEKLNSIVRLSLYIGIVLTMISKKFFYIYAPLIIMGFTCLIYKTHDNIYEDYKEYSKCNPSGSAITETILPTNDNPFMNFNHITSDRYTKPAPTLHSSPKVQEDIHSKFNNNLYRDVSDMYNKNNSQREFYTMPVTEAVNNQKEFANWLYNTGPTCKEKTINCIPGINSTPII
jgi:hypothetical protein